MSEQQVWIITPPGRGLEAEITTVALEAGHNVVATGRNTEAVTAALGQAANLLVAKLDITSPHDAHETVAAIGHSARLICSSTTQRTSTRASLKS